MSHEYLQTKRNQALQSTETARANRRNELTKSPFGPERSTSAQDAISYGDAQDSASSIPSEC
jgi:hypothetical protein